jgi:hypothetical protein
MVGHQEVAVLVVVVELPQVGLVAQAVVAR